MIRISMDVMIDPMEVAHMEWDRRFYMNGSDSTLVITMSTGRVYRLRSDPYNLEYAPSKIEQAILRARGG